MNAFDYVNAINHSKVNLITDYQSEKEYVPFLTNRALSYFSETLIDAIFMSMSAHLDKKLQFDYLINTVRPAKRFSKWGKKKEDKNIERVQRYYQCNIKRAKEIVDLFSLEQLQLLEKELEKGG